MPRKMLEREDQVTLIRLFRWLMLIAAIITMLMLGIAMFA